ncbi:MAG: hypothetical protein IPJ30_11740 [Acidobacteria bacterium]|nr:hypothetical protein [Acidobacteriota bacterium]MBK8149837.1 hypothetical protein [Acidobacteriota bacterium]
MLFVNLLVNEKLLDAETALSRADDPAKIIGLCRDYLVLLNVYRDELGKLREDRRIAARHTSPLARELTEQVRRAIRTAVEVTTRERNHAERLLESLTAISGYEAMETFNLLAFRGLSNWEVRAGGVRAKSANGDAFFTIDESVAAAAILRCEEYAATKRTFFRDAGDTAAAA